MKQVLTTNLKQATVALTKTSAQVTTTLDGVVLSVATIENGKLSAIRKFKIRDYALEYRNDELYRLCNYFEEVTGNPVPQIDGGFTGA